MSRASYTYSYLHLEQAFVMEQGGVLEQPTIAYNTYGELNKTKDNVIFICHALTANSDADDWWHGLFGKGDIFDWDKYFIVCANNLGSPYGTSSAIQINPATKEPYGLDFPFFTIRDTAKLHLAFLQHFGIEKIKLLIGGSCGGNIAQEMAYSLDDKVENLALLCCSARESPWAIAIHEAQRLVLRADETLSNKTEDAGIKALKACRATALPYYRTQKSFNIRQSEIDSNVITDFRSSSYINYQGEKFINRFSAPCYYTLLNALDTHNMGRARNSIEEALAKISANTAVIGFESDLLIPVEEQQFLAKHIPNADYFEIKSIYGHDAFLIEHEHIRRAIRSKINLW
ncbi:MAG: homoserine O-acetyltransferase [Bacteroidota bacterium]